MGLFVKHTDGCPDRGDEGLSLTTEEVRWACVLNRHEEALMGEPAGLRAPYGQYSQSERAGCGEGHTDVFPDRKDGH